MKICTQIQRSCNTFQISKNHKAMCNSVKVIKLLVKLIFCGLEVVLIGSKETTFKKDHDQTV